MKIKAHWVVITLIVLAVAALFYNHYEQSSTTNEPGLEGS